MTVDWVKLSLAKPSCHLHLPLPPGFPSSLTPSPFITGWLLTPLLIWKSPAELHNALDNCGTMAPHGGGAQWGHIGHIMLCMRAIAHALNKMIISNNDSILIYVPRFLQCVHTTEHSGTICWRFIKATNFCSNPIIKPEWCWRQEYYYYNRFETSKDMTRSLGCI